MEQAKEDQIINLCLVYLPKPFCSPDHIGPKSIIKEEIGKDVSPPPVVGSLNILPSFQNAMEGVLGDLQFSISVSTNRNEEGNYLESCQVMSIT